MTRQFFKDEPRVEPALPFETLSMKEFSRTSQISWSLVVRRAAPVAKQIWEDPRHSVQEGRQPSYLSSPALTLSTLSTAETLETRHPERFFPVNYLNYRLKLHHSRPMANNPCMAVVVAHRPWLPSLFQLLPLTPDRLLPHELRETHLGHPHQRLHLRQFLYRST